jgi:hypothetical protein
MAVEQNITSEDEWWAGEDRVLRWAIQTEAGDPQNLTGWNIGFSMEDQLQKVASIENPPTAGVCSVGTVSAETEVIKPGVYGYTLRRTDEGSEAVLAYGTVRLKGGV